MFTSVGVTQNNLTIFLWNMIFNIPMNICITSFSQNTFVYKIRHVWVFLFFFCLIFVYDDYRLYKILYLVRACVGISKMTRNNTRMRSRASIMLWIKRGPRNVGDVMYILQFSVGWTVSLLMWLICWMIWIWPIWGACGSAWLCHNFFSFFLTKSTHSWWRNTFHSSTCKNRLVRSDILLLWPFTNTFNHC